MKKSGLKIIFVALFLTILVSSIKSQPREQVFIGARPLGLGETYAAIADDGNTVYWNPAGLPNLKRIEFNSMYANLYNISGLQNIFLSLVYPISPRFAFGFGYFGVDFGDSELDFFRNKANLSLGAKVYKNLLLGASLKYLSTDASLDRTSEGKADGFGFDLGAFYSLPVSRTGFLKQLNFALVAYDVAGTDIKFDDTSETVLRQNIRFGLAVIPKEDISFGILTLKDALLAIDIDDRFHLGTEFWPIDHLGLRAGFQRDFNTGEGATYSFGGSFKFPKLSMQLDYAYVIPPTLAATHFFSFSFASSPSPIKITDMNVNPLFSSFYKSYASSPIGSVTVRNDYDDALELTVKVSVPGLTVTQAQDSFKLGPGERRETFFTAVFSKDILNVRAREIRQAKIEVEYKIRNEAKTLEASKEFTLFGRGAITWEDPGKAAAFITKLDKMVELFALESTKDLSYRPEIEFGKIYTAAALFNAMGAIGIKYTEDTVNPFSTIPKSQHKVDHIKYPAELLTKKRGDCDDLTVLYASLLEYSGIRTALLSTEDHITLMFDTGIHERNWGLLPLNDTLLVVKNKTFWIPVEVTEVGTSFINAWQIGAKAYWDSKQGDDFKELMVSDLEGVYLNALPEEYQNRIPELPESKKLKALLDKDILSIQLKRKSAIVNWLIELQSDTTNYMLRNELGIIFAQIDSLKWAEEEFRNTIANDPSNGYALTNLANIDFILGRFEDAENNYIKAVELIPSEPGLYLNLAILYQIWKEQHADSLRLQRYSEERLSQAFQLLEGVEEKALDLFAIRTDEVTWGEKAGIKEIAQAIKKFIKDSARKYLFDKSIKGTKVKRAAVKRGPDDERRYILWWATTRISDYVQTASKI